MERAYAAVVYIYTEDREGHSSTKLLMAKTRIDILYYRYYIIDILPLKIISIPRLEPVALLLSETMLKVKTLLRINIHKEYA